MKFYLYFLFLVSFLSCAIQSPQFAKERDCSNEALKYLRNPRNISKSFTGHPKLVEDIQRTVPEMQICYEDFKKRTGYDEFNTCLVVGIDEKGEMDFYNFGSRQIELDEKFLQCARYLTQNLPYSSYGSNYIFVQSYKFYFD